MTDGKREGGPPPDAPAPKGPGFARAEMAACEACRRPNPPTRMSCLYCGAPLPESRETEALRRPALRRPEAWEPGFNIVLVPGGAARDADGPAGGFDGARVSADALEEGASLLRLEPQFLSDALAARRALPLALAASREEAAFVGRRLAALGFAVEVVPDELLAGDDSTPARARKLWFDADALTARTGVAGETQTAAWEDVLLIVRGRLFSKRVEVEERRTRFGAESKVADERELFEDEGVLDLFARARDGSDAHWRVTSDNFDYSPLGPRKSLLARDNFETLTGLLRERAPRAGYDEDYARLRRLLAPAWPPDERREAAGLRRVRPGKFNVEAVTRVGNETQFTRYARLLYQLELRRREGA